MNRLSVERAIDELRRGRAVALQQGDVQFALLALDFLSDDSRARFAGSVKTDPLLLISGRRAQTLKLTQFAPAAGQDAVAMHIAKTMSLGELIAVADPVEDLAFPIKGPFRLAGVGDASLRAAAVQMMKLARLLPAALIAPISEMPDNWLSVKPEDIASFAANTAESLHIVTRARVPLAGAEQCEIIAFRSDDGGLEHLAVVIGDPSQDRPVLARLHSECFTGDLLGSLKCDCGPQLKGALAAIAKEGAGVLLYLAQEGRGIGLINKLRAYALQDQGFDTVDANTRLGFEMDERSFAPAARMLALLGFSSVRLMTNNPDKVAALEAHGVQVVERVAHQFPSNDHNAFYLATKRARSGHWLT